MCAPLTASTFWSKVEKLGPADCWLWNGDRDRQNYGRLWVGDKKKLAHRVAWELANENPIPTGLVACHSCDNPACVNPSHIWLGTVGDNNRDMAAKGRNAMQKITHCPKGHAYSPENTYRSPRGGRFCRTCNRAAVAARKARVMMAAKADAQ